MNIVKFFSTMLIILMFSMLPAWAEESAPAPKSAYVLGVNDEIKLSIFGEPDLSGLYKVNEAGVISVPLIGEVQVQGLSPEAARDLIIAKFADGYLVDPSISLEVATQRPFYILGEVRKPGSYDYVSDMTVLNAVALAGGFTYRANQRKVKIRPEGADEQAGYERRPVESRVMPGDTIMVEERFF